MTRIIKTWGRGRPLRVEKSGAKYRAKRTLLDGILFDSMKEAKRYAELKVLRAAGEVRLVVLQPRFQISDTLLDPEGRVAARGEAYVADFLIVWASGAVTVEDVKGATRDRKGKPTKAYAEFLRKKRRAEAIHGIVVEEV